MSIYFVTKAHGKTARGQNVRGRFPVFFYSFPNWAKDAFIAGYNSVYSR